MPEVRLALTCDEIVLLLSYVDVGNVGWRLRFEKLYAFLAELAQAPIYRNGPQIDVIEPN